MWQFIQLLLSNSEKNLALATLADVSRRRPTDQCLTGSLHLDQVQSWMQRLEDPSACLKACTHSPAFNSNTSFDTSNMDWRNPTVQQVDHFNETSMHDGNLAFESSSGMTGIVFCRTEGLLSHETTAEDNGGHLILQTAAWYLYPNSIWEQSVSVQPSSLQAFEQLPKSPICSLHPPDDLVQCFQAMIWSHISIDINGDLKYVYSWFQILYIWYVLGAEISS